MNLFPRICRCLGRFLLTIGAIFLVGFICLFFTSLTPDHQSIEEFRDSLAIQNISDAGTVITTTASSTPVLLLILGIVASLAILFCFFRALKSYNDFLRNFIKRAAKTLHLKIFTLELISTTVIWGFLILILLNLLPIFTPFLLTALIINEFCFIFAWVAYGQPDYLC